jgi:N6-L-threonylcarbamoyladenine synthase
MIVLGIESSCDETAAAVLKNGTTILSSIVASQASIHRAYGGVVPELASREHVDNICFVVEASLEEASLKLSDIDTIAVTRGPGLMGALLVGLTYAKGLAYALKIPFVGVNHLEGHICSIFLDNPLAELPALSLVVSGGHTSLFHIPRAGSYELLARTRDDAAGEALDKLSKLLGLGYPGGPVIDRLAPLGNPEAVRFSLPKISDGSMDFSFSGIKTAALRHFQGLAVPSFDPDDHQNLPGEILDLIASYQKRIIDQILNRLDRALENHSVQAIHLSGGVSCNSELRRRSSEHFKARKMPVYFPRPSLTTDNAAMIAGAAYTRLQSGSSDPWTLGADPNLPVV